jgi:hypothetical protein
MLTEINMTNRTDIEKILEQIRQNSVLLSKQHKNNYLDLKKSLKYYRLPVIVISALNSVFSIGLQPFMSQTTISLINCGLAMGVGMIGSIELFYGITKKMELELISSKDYYVLSADIYKFLSLDKDNRTITEKIFLDEAYGRYIILIESSSILKKPIKDGISYVHVIKDDDESPDNDDSSNTKCIKNETGEGYEQPSPQYYDCYNENYAELETDPVYP